MFERVKDVDHPDEELLSIYREHGVVKRAERADNHNKAALDRSIYQLIHPGWLAVNRMKAWQGSVGVSPYRGIVSGHYICFRPKHREDHRYLNWLFRSAVYTSEYASLSRGVRPNQVEIDNEWLRTLRVMLPSLEEQRRIADYLDAETDRIDRLSRMRKTQVSLIEERLLTIWGQTISSDGSTRRLPLRRFITAITDGPFGSALTSSHYSDSGAQVIRLGNLGRAEFRDRERAYIPIEYFAGLKRHEAVTGDLIVAGLGDQGQPLGRACVLPEGVGPAMVKADCFRVRLDQTTMLHEYAAWALSSPPVAEQIAMLARGSTRARINLEVVRDITLPAPAIERQRRSIAQLTEARASTLAVSRRCNRQLALLAERRQALITAAVTGQFDVSTASGRNVTDGV
ncbi:restriction endonuclease subunit S [Streptomyces parvus]|uniref:restriction endonuclease subunit S n=1 Tax=Streptomyces parvus TaxID=66428 RepID=UPI0033BB2CF2